jgi:cephalosporin hydroxylase
MFAKLKPKTKNHYQSPVVNPNSSELELNKWIISDFVSEVLYPITKNRPFPLDEQMLMTETVCRFKPKYIFDWGTHIGKSARIFWEIKNAFNIDCEIHSIDLPDEEEHVEHPGQRRGELVLHLKDVKLHQGDGVSKSIEIYNKIAKNNETAIFYVDGDHSYDSVKRELGKILEEIKNPIILLHDTFNQDKKSKYNTGPHRAINYCLKNTNKKYSRIETQLGLPGMTLLYPANFVS